MGSPKMNIQLLTDTAKRMVGDGKGLLAIDESISTCDKRFAEYSIAQNEEARRAYRELIITTPGIEKYISGFILYDETIHQKTKAGIPFIKVITDRGIIPGIKVDIGAKDLAGHVGETITEGLDGLRERLTKYFETGARFAKWRAVVHLSDNLPSEGCVKANAEALARYAALCQEVGLVPIVEPEVLMEGDHPLARCLEVTERVLRSVFNELYLQRVQLEAMILKPNMVLPGLKCSHQESIDEVADATVKCLLRVVPAAVSGIAFLSGGQSCELASSRLNTMNLRFNSRMPWPLSFSFGRAIQQPALELWQGKESNVLAAQNALYHRAKCNGAARDGVYSAVMETDSNSSFPVVVPVNIATAKMSLVPSLKDIDSHRKFIVGNWKMYTNTSEARHLTQGIVDGLGDEERVSVAVCPPFPYLALVGEILKGSPIALGAQNLFPEKQGAFTGEVSPTMLLDLGCKYVILGHSERRNLFGESDSFINQKVRFALSVGLEVILCIGETLAQRDAGETESILASQLTSGLAGIRKELVDKVSVAYEPIWAIGIHGHQATPAQAKIAHATIRRHFGEIFNQKPAEALIIQYGGSVKPANAASLLSQEGVDGALVGGASLNAKQFLSIIQCAIDELSGEKVSA
jgi:fructose-bisphosphate aldolase class I